MRYHVSLVAEFLTQMAVAVPALVLWLAAVTLLGRAFGVGLPFRILGRRNGTSQGRTFSQHMWFTGVLGWGCGMWIVTTLGDYLDWKYWSGSAHDLSAGKLLFHAVLWPLAGLLFGWMTWNTRNG
jgi:hypothetical protein